VTELKTPLDERALDRLTLATDAALVAYEEQRLKLQAARKVRDSRQRDDLGRTQTGGADEIGQAICDTAKKALKDCGKQAEARSNADVSDR
jgi:hypothetical protein